MEDPDLDNLLSRWCLLWVNNIGHRLPWGTYVMIVFGTVSDLAYIYDDRGRVNWLTWLCRLKQAWCWRCANNSVTSLRMDDISAGRRQTYLSECSELYVHVGLGAAARARGQIDDISIFNLINNLALRGQGSWSVDLDRWTLMCEHRCSTYDGYLAE